MAQTWNGMSLIGELGYDGTFDEFYTEFLLRFVEEMEPIFQGASLKWESQRDVMVQLLCFLKDSLCGLGIRTLIYELHKYLESPDFPTASEAQIYVDFCRKLMQGLANEILEEYPMLHFLMDHKEKTAVNMLQGLFKHLEADSALLEKTFHIDTSAISSIEVGKGDTHSHLAVISFASGNKVVYKPRSMDAELAYGKLCDWMNARMPQSPLRHAAVINQGDYGWQSYIGRKDCGTASEACAYFYRIGKNMALFFMLNATDLHRGDILQCGEDPFFVDLETLSCPPKRNLQDGSLICAVRGHLRDSVFASAILPDAFGDSIVDVGLSGVWEMPGKRAPRRKRKGLVNKGRSDIHFEEIPYVEDGMWHGVGLNFINAIEQGFRDACNLFLKERQPFKEAIHLAMESGRYRQPLRRGFVYDKLLEASLHPKHLRDGAGRRHMLMLIGNVGMAQAESEVLQMMRHDVPYFAADYGSTDLLTMGQTVEKGFLQKSIQEHLQERVDSLDGAGIERQIAYMHNATMLSKRASMGQQEEAGGRDRIACASDSAEDVLAAIRESIEAAAIWNEGHTACTFIDVLFGERASLGPIGNDLYHGLGLAWFLYAYADYTKSRQDWEFADAVCKGMQIQDENVSLPTGVFIGGFSSLYLYLNLYRLTGREEFACKCGELWEKSAAYSPQGGGCFGILSGISGAALMLAHLYGQYPSKECGMRLEQYAGILAKKCSQGQGMRAGFANGMAGLATALQLAGMALGNEAWINTARQVQQEEDRSYCGEALNWADSREGRGRFGMSWRHGAPGILLGRSYYMEDGEYWDRYQNVIEHMARRTVGDGMDDSLCHGSAGNLDILRAIARNKDRPQLDDGVRKMQQHLLEKTARDGVAYAIPQMKGMLSFMPGLSGIGYGILRGLNPKLPCVLALELYGGN